MAKSGPIPDRRPVWNVFLLNRGEKLCPYVSARNISDLRVWTDRALSKMLDGSDADGVVIIRSDYPVPDTWPGERG